MRLIVTVAAAVAVAGGLTLATPVLTTSPSAEAAVPAVRVRVCNNLPSADVLHVRGLNHEEVFVTSNSLRLASRACTDVHSIRWAQGQQLSLYAFGAAVGSLCPIWDGQWDGTLVTCSLG